jgi:hypothetical protein
MSNLFGGGKIPKPQFVSPAAQLPTGGPDIEDYAAQLARKRSGFQKTIITGAMRPKQQQKKTVLG